MTSLMLAGSPDAQTDPWPPRRVAWWGLAMLVVSYAVAIVDRVGMGLLVQPIKATLGISDAQVGLLQGAGFAIFFALLGLPAGLLADRRDRRYLIAIGMVIWSLATAGCGLATTFALLFMARVGVGAGEAALSPAGTSMIGDFFRPSQRSRAFAVFSLGSALGTGSAFLFSGSVIQFADWLVASYPDALHRYAPWQIVFILFSLPGLLLAPLFALTVREPVRQERGTIPERASLGPLMERLATHRLAYATMIGGAVASSISTYSLIGWFPTFLIRAYDWSASETAFVMGTYGMPCGIVSSLGAGWIVSYFERQKRNDAPIFVAMLALCGIAAGSVIIALSATPLVAVIGYLLMGLAMNVPFVSLLTALNRATPNGLRGQVLAVMTISTNLVAQTIGPFAVGFLSDNLFPTRFGIGQSLSVVVVTACACAAVGLYMGRRAILRADVSYSSPI